MDEEEILAYVRQLKKIFKCLVGQISHSILKTTQWVSAKLQYNKYFSVNDETHSIKKLSTSQQKPRTLVEKLPFGKPF